MSPFSLEYLSGDVNQLCWSFLSGSISPYFFSNLKVREFGILIFGTFSAIFRIGRDYLGVSGGEYRGTRRKSLTYCLTALVTGNFLTYPDRDLKLGSAERQRAVSGNALNHTAIRVNPSMTI